MSTFDPSNSASASDSTSDSSAHPLDLSESSDPFDAFDSFVERFFAIFKQLRFQTYLRKPAPRRSGDEAFIVDNAITGPLLELLGFSHAAQVYNQGNRFGRPDFMPSTEEYGVCFVVEDKSTGIELDLDISDPESHLSQLTGYLRSLGLRYGWLMNGVRLMVWRLDNPLEPTCTLDLDIPNALREWEVDERASLSKPTLLALRQIWEQFRRATFADWQRLESEIGMEGEAWEKQALPVGANPANQDLLVGAVRTLLQDLQADARGYLDDHLARYASYERRANRLQQDDAETALERLEKLRNQTLIELQRVGALIGLAPQEADALRESLYQLERDPFTYLNTRELLDKTLATLNAARERRFPNDKKAAKAWSKYDNGLGGLGDALKAYGDTAFAWHKRKAFLRHDNRTSIEVHENYSIWTAIVQETMLGGLNEDQRRDEFALQASYVVFIRLMLIRVCEDKGILRFRLLSNGGLKHWQEDIERYFQFATGNPDEPLLNMAFQNAQNIYAHFFTGRELFNWYTLSRLRFIRVLYQLSRFNFADVDSDLIGTIYNTYVERPEKKQKGQYYTPPQIVRYILDESGYTTGPEIIGPNRRLIDPACGSGTFLVEAARRLVRAHSAAGGTPARQLIDRVRDNLYGFDLNPFACYLAEVNLLIQVLDLVKQALDGNTPPNLQRFHIYNVDALAPSRGMLYFVRTNTLMAEEMDVVDRIKGRLEEYRTGFRWVVANPPYGAGLTESYKLALRDWWPTVFYGRPDSYVFFFALGLHLLGANGRLGFITPNTYLMGTNTAPLRAQLLTAGRITQIVDLPQGIWQDANVDCALLFLALDPDEDRRRAQETQVFSMDIRDTLERLTERQWKETLTQPQSTWIDDTSHEMNIRWTPLLTQIEEACRVTVNDGAGTTILRLGDITESSVGIDPYATTAEGRANLYIKPQRDLPQGETEWKPLLDSKAFIGRYEQRWPKTRPHIKYGRWLCRPREPRFFDSPKLITQQIRNRALKRRLVATYDSTGFYHRKNFNNIITGDQVYNLKYILALFNSSVLNYWYARHYDNVNINPDYFRTLPIYPADGATQAELVALVDEMLAMNARLNVLREQGYLIRTRQDGERIIRVPYDLLLAQMQQADPDLPVYTLVDARAAGLLVVPEKCDTGAQIAKVFTPDKHPNTVVLRTNQLWLEVNDPDIRRYLLNYLACPQWRRRSWDDISSIALLPEPPETLLQLFAAEARIVAEIDALLDAIAATDTEIDNRVLDLYGITDPTDRQRILGSAPLNEDAHATSIGTENETDNGTENGIDTEVDSETVSEEPE